MSISSRTRCSILSAALHELAANAIKHGSLSRPKGQLELHWSVERTDRGMTLIMDWVEKNGPPARRPRKTGFGTRLIDLVIQRQLNGEVCALFPAQRPDRQNAGAAHP